MKSVAIIGGGVSGLLALRHSLNSKVLKPVLYEGTKRIGGVWAYEDEIPEGVEFKDDDAVSIYENMVTNQSKEIMTFPDFPHHDGLPSFLPHEKVLEYLKEYAVHFGLEKWMKFGHKVRKVTPVFSEEGETAKSDAVRWRVDVFNYEKNEVFSEIFDAVLVCNGHFSKPRIPKIPGMEGFHGKILHSRSYRRPARFAGEDVLVVGAAPSGVDISFDIAPVAKKIYLCNRGQRLQSKMPKSILEVPEIRHFNEDGKGVTFVNGRTVQVSSVILCTGYMYNFPFLDEHCGIRVDGNRVNPLFKHIVNIKHNTMLFIGIPHRFPVFPILSLQAIFATRVLSGRVVLPSEEEMLVDEAADFNARLKLGWPQYKAHIMSGRVFEYADSLADAAGSDRIPDNLRRLYKLISYRRAFSLQTYKGENFELDDRNEYVLKQPSISEKDTSPNGFHISQKLV